MFKSPTDLKTSFLRWSSGFPSKISDWVSGSKVSGTLVSWELVQSATRLPPLHLQIHAGVLIQLLPWNFSDDDLPADSLTNSSSKK